MDWIELYHFRVHKHANLYPYSGRDPYLQFMDAMWILAIEASCF